jgi:branched-chain amino acid transport system permease protein
MFDWLNITIPTGMALYSQLLIGLINGSFYALLSLGLAIIFGLLGVINFAHGAQYMVGAFCAWALLTYGGIGYWPALVIAPVIVGAAGLLLERTLIRPTYKLDHAYSLLLTFGLTLIIEGVFRQIFGTFGQPYQMPSSLTGATNLGFMYLPNYRAWVLVASVVICAATWFFIERTQLGSYMRAATENPKLTQALGVNVPMLMAVTYAIGVGLAALAGVMAAPIYQVSPLMGSEVIIIVFAVVVIGGMGSILGSIVSGFALGLVEGLAKAFYPPASSVVIFLAMAIILLIRPAGLFGRAAIVPAALSIVRGGVDTRISPLLSTALLFLAIVAPFVFYPVFLMKALCFALFACSFNLVLGYGGLLSFGHTAFFGGAAYATAHAIKVWGFPPELGILAGVAAGALLGAIFGVIAIRRQGIYLAMVTLALAQMLYFIAVQAPFTGGEDGIQSVPRGKLFGFLDLSDQMTLYYVVLAIFVIGFTFFCRVISSPFGQALRAIRENEGRAVSLGYRSNVFKVICFVLSGALAGLGGGTKVLVFGIASLTDVHFAMSGEVILMVLLGGLGTILGPVVGAFTIIAMESYLQDYGAWIKVIQGVIFVICVLSFRQGLVGEIERLGRFAKPLVLRLGGRGAGSAVHSRP